MAPVGLQSVSSGEPSENRGALKQEGAALLNPRPLPSTPASDTGSPTYASHHAHPAGMPGQGPHHPSHTRPSVVCSPSKCRRVPSALPGPRFMLEGLSGEIWDGGRADLPAPLRCLVPAPAHPTFCPPGWAERWASRAALLPSQGLPGGPGSSQGGAQHPSAPHRSPHGGESLPRSEHRGSWSESRVALVSATW